MGSSMCTMLKTSSLINLHVFTTNIQYMLFTIYSLCMLKLICRETLNLSTIFFMALNKALTYYSNDECTNVIMYLLSCYRWWKELGLANDLKFARNEPIKWYMWPMACLPDPRFSEERTELTKPLSLIYIIDDIFDFHGNIEELSLFTDAVKR